LRFSRTVEKDAQGALGAMVPARPATTGRADEQRAESVMWSCVIVAARPAGLNAALVLGRARRRVVVLERRLAAAHRPRPGVRL
jgi:NADPH-dependent 2,4-dienoyl-CoA reductase/sulfur reductase-like enzyme